MQKIFLQLHFAAVRGRTMRTMGAKMLWMAIGLPGRLAVSTLGNSEWGIPTYIYIITVYIYIYKYDILFILLYILYYIIYNIIYYIYDILYIHILYIHIESYRESDKSIDSIDA